MISIWRRKISVNTSIPGFKSKDQLITLSKLIRRLPWNSTIVELGACAGLGTWTISKNAPLFSKVYAIDSWCDKNVFWGKGNNLDPQQQGSLKYFLYHVQDCSNITAVQSDVLDMNFQKPIDCLILDCDRGLGRNQYPAIWSKWRLNLNPKALVIGANYFPEVRPDEVDFAHSVRDQLGNFGFENGIWWSSQVKYFNKIIREH